MTNVCYKRGNLIGKMEQVRVQEVEWNDWLNFRHFEIYFFSVTERLRALSNCWRCGIVVNLKIPIDQITDGNKLKLNTWIARVMMSHSLHSDFVTFTYACALVQTAWLVFHFVHCVWLLVNNVRLDFNWFIYKGLILWPFLNVPTRLFCVYFVHQYMNSCVFHAQITCHTTWKLVVWTKTHNFGFLSYQNGIKFQVVTSANQMIDSLNYWWVIYWLLYLI